MRHVTWTHFRELIAIEDPLKRHFYVELCRLERWSTRTLTAKVNSMLYEQKLGVDLGHVRVFTGTFAEEFNRQRNADAVTIGGTGMILMGNSTDRSMATADGQALLAHELTHVAQAEKGVHRAGHGTDLVLASEEHEAEAEAAEAQAAAEHKGEAQTQGAGHAKHEQGAAKKQNTEKLREEIKEKVLEMLGEWGRVEEMRSGHAMRRP